MRSSGARGVPAPRLESEESSSARRPAPRSKATDRNIPPLLPHNHTSPLKPVEEMLMTALHTSRATLRTLVERQSLLEAEIAKEQKQAARIEWLLNRCRADYAFFSTLDQMNQESK